MEQTEQPLPLEARVRALEIALTNLLYLIRQRGLLDDDDLEMIAGSQAENATGLLIKDPPQTDRARAELAWGYISD